MITKNKLLEAAQGTLSPDQYEAFIGIDEADADAFVRLASRLTKILTYIEKFDVVIFEDNGTRYVYCDSACAAISGPGAEDKIIAEFSNVRSKP